MNQVRNLVALARRNAPTIATVAIAGAAFLIPEMAWAGSAQGLPWESPLQKLQDSVTGPVAMAIAIIGVVACCAALIWGGEMNEFLRKMVMLVLVIAGLVAATGLISKLFNANGASISPALYAAANLGPVPAAVVGAARVVIPAYV